MTCTSVMFLVTSLKPRFHIDCSLSVFRGELRSIFMELDLHGHRRFKTNLTLQVNFFFRSVRADTLKNLYDCYSCENTRLQGISAVLRDQFI